MPLQQAYERIQGPIFVLFDFLQGKTDFINVAVSFFAVLVIIFAVFPFHECAHAVSAKLLGDDTAEREGRLTLNPLVHIDKFGAIAMMFVCIGWAKPVPVNPNRCTKVKPKTAVMLTAAAGPFSNMILALIFIIIEKILLRVLYSEAHIEAVLANPNLVYIAVAFGIAAQLSVFLGVFNLIPLPPLDGSKVLFFFLNKRQIYFFEKNYNVIWAVFMVLLFFTDIITGIIGLFSGFILTGLNALTFFI